jgi:RNA polymerase-associated protein
MARRRPAVGTVKPAPNAGLTLYAANDAVASDWVRLVLAEKEVDSARVRLLASGQFDEDLATLNPAQTLPTLADREGVLFGAAVIAEYLDERYPHPKLMPPAPAERARVRMALLHIERELFPLVAAAREGKAARNQLSRALRENLEAGARHSGARAWFLGFDYNLADCAWAVLLRRLQPADLTASPGVAQYAQRLFARPAFQRCFAGAPGV